MDYKDKDGRPLVKWSTPEQAFDAWCAFSKGWVCDYSGLSYDILRGGSGIPWPCNDQYPRGCERLYTDLVFPTSSGSCQTYGHDLETGAAVSGDEYKANDPAGRAILKPAEYKPPFEEACAEFPFILTTGRLIYHFHSRTKTARSKELQEAAPQAFAQIASQDAARLGINDGEPVEVFSRRGKIVVPARVGDIIPGHIFIPFHYGYWDAHDAQTAANELTLTAWDPVSKQPIFKTTAVNLRKVAGDTNDQVKHVKEELSHAKTLMKETTDKAIGKAHKPYRRFVDMIGMCIECNRELDEFLKVLSKEYFEEVDFAHSMMTLASFSHESNELIKPFIDKYGEGSIDEPKRLRKSFTPVLPDAYGMIRDLQRLYILTYHAQSALMLLDKCAHALRDADMVHACQKALELNKRQHSFIKTQLEHRAAAVLTTKW
jgi:formylmethanofuran dehydrogenase subunit D